MFQLTFPTRDSLVTAMIYHVIVTLKQSKFQTSRIAIVGTKKCEIPLIVTSVALLCTKSCMLNDPFISAGNNLNMELRKL